MTEKRFEVVKTMSDNNVAIKDMTDMTTHQMLDYGSALDICILLNKLNDKADRNEQLKQQLKSKERLIGAYEQFIHDLKEDGVLDD